MKNETSQFKKLFDNFENMKDENKDKLLKVGEKILGIESFVYETDKKQAPIELKNN